MRRIFNYIKGEVQYVRDKINAIVSNERSGKRLKETNKYIERELVKNKKLFPAKDLKFPIVYDDNFSKYLQKFLHSYRNKDNALININNLLFLSGPEKIGKSWFLRHNLKNFVESDLEQKHFAIHYDIREIHNQGFNSFIFNFETTLIDALVEKNIFEHSKGRKDIISLEDLSKVLHYRWERSMVEMYISRTLHRAIQNSAFTFSISIEFFDEVNAMLEEHENKGYNSTPLINDHLNRIIEIISISEQTDPLRSYLLLIQDVLIQKENTEKNSVYDNELYRTGLETMEFFLDVLNFIGGYHELQSEVNNDLFLTKNFYPHVVLAIESVQCFWEMKDVEKRALDFMDTIILRLYNNQGYRNHIPVVFETNKNHFFDMDIYKQLFDHKYVFPSLVYLPIQFHREIEKNLSNIFNNYQMYILTVFLKDSSVYFYKLLFECFKNAETIDFENIISFSDSNSLRELVRFTYKINRIYLNPMMAKHLDDGSIDYEIVDFLKQMNHLYEKNYIPTLKIRNEPYDYEFLRNNTTKAFFEENIIFFNKYNKLVTLQHYIYNHFINYVYPAMMMKKILISRNKYYYFTLYYSPFKAFKFCINYYTIGVRRSFSKTNKPLEEMSHTQFIHGFDLRWDIPMELYKGNVTFPNYMDSQFKTYTLY